MYAKCDKNIPCGSRAMNISLTGNGRTDSHSDYSAEPLVEQYMVLQTFLSQKTLNLHFQNIIF